MVIPYVRKAGRMNKPMPTFNGHRYTLNQIPVNAPPLKPSIAPTAGSATLSSSSKILEKGLQPDADTLPTDRDQAVDIHPDLKTARLFNAREEKKLYGAPLRSEAEESTTEQASPLLGFYALGIATAIVGGSAAIGVWVVARLMGVKHVSLLLPLWSFDI